MDNFDTLPAGLKAAYFAQANSHKAMCEAQEALRLSDPGAARRARRLEFETARNAWEKDCDYCRDMERWYATGVMPVTLDERGAL